MNDEICGHEECGRLRIDHREGSMSCPTDLTIFGVKCWHPANRFTPRKEGRAKQCPRCGSKVHLLKQTGGNWVCEGCCREIEYQANPHSVTDQSGVTTPPAFPPGRLPFDLDKALKGVRLVTRDGADATNLRPYRGYWLATVKGSTWGYDECGRVVGFDTDQPEDLFLAGEEGKTVTAKAFGPCARCGATTQEKFCDNCPPPPETETETQRQAQSEIDRQIEVMKASKDPGAVVEEMPLLHRANEPWREAHRSSDGHYCFNWFNNNYRIKPAETKPRPRVVWVKFAHGVVYESADSQIDKSYQRFIELNWIIANAPEVLSALKAAGIEIE